MLTDLQPGTTCIICMLEGADMKKKNKEFNCNCSVYFHEKCWTDFCQTLPVKCPYCKKARPLPINLIKYIRGKVITFLAVLLILAFYGMYIYAGLSLPTDAENYWGILHLCIGYPVLFTISYAMLFCTLYYNVPVPIVNMWKIFGNFYALVLFIFSHIYVFSRQLDKYLLAVASVCVSMGILYGYLILLIYECWVQYRPPVAPAEDALELRRQVDNV